MKALRALMLALTLSASAYAGPMDNGRSPVPTPTPEPTNNMTEPADDESVVATSESPEPETLVTEVTLSVLQNILALF